MRRALHHNIHDGTSQFGQGKPRLKEAAGTWNLVSLQHFPNVENELSRDVARGSNRFAEAMTWINERSKLRL